MNGRRAKRISVDRIVNREHVPDLSSSHYHAPLFLIPFHIVLLNPSLDPPTSNRFYVNEPDMQGLSPGDNWRNEQKRGHESCSYRKKITKISKYFSDPFIFEFDSVIAFSYRGGCRKRRSSISDGTRYVCFIIAATQHRYSPETYRLMALQIDKRISFAQRLAIKIFRLPVFNANIVLQHRRIKQNLRVTFATLATVLLFANNSNASTRAHVRSYRAQYCRRYFRAKLQPREKGITRYR